VLFFESIAFQFHFEVPWKRHWTWGTMDFLSQARHTLLASELFPGNAFGYGHSSDGFLNMFPISNHFRRQHHTHSIMYIYVYLFIYICLSCYPKTIINRCNWCFLLQIAPFIMQIAVGSGWGDDHGDHSSRARRLTPGRMPIPKALPSPKMVPCHRWSTGYFTTKRWDFSWELKHVEAAKIPSGNLT